MGSVNQREEGHPPKSPLSPAKAALLERLRRGGSPETARDGIQVHQGDDPAPLSFAQERLWFLHELDPESAAYNMVNAYRLRGPLDEQALRQALDEIARRHEPLRTTYETCDGRPVQVIHEEQGIPLEAVDLSALDEEAREATRERIVHEEVITPIDLRRGPVARARLLRLADDDHELVVTVHHIAFDEISELRFTQEIAILYAAHQAGEASSLPAPSVRYRDHARWQRTGGGAASDDALAYWRERMRDVPALELPTDAPRPGTPSGSGRMHMFTLPPELSSRVRAMCRDQGVTLYMGLLAAFEAVLHRYSGQEDFAIGTPVSGRTRPEVDDLIGFFVNTLPLRADLSGRPTFKELLVRVKQAALEAFSRGEVPFERIVEAAAPERDPRRSPLFQVLFSLQNDAVGATREMPGLELEARFVESPTAKFDLSLYALDHPEGIRFWVEYATDLFHDDTIRRFAGHLRTLLDDACARPDQTIDALALLTPAERERLLGVRGPDTPPQPSVTERFALAARAYPEREAVITDDARVTYAELDGLSDRVAHRLRASGVTPGDPVALCVERGVGLVGGVLGILKAGAAYIPLDPAFPEERLRLMIADAQAPFVLVDATNASRFDVAAGASVVTLEAAMQSGGEGPFAAERPDGAALAYVVYTSGSTGRPKGTTITHGGLANVLHAVETELEVGPDDTLLGITTASFDIGSLELLLPLVTGARLRLHGRDAARDPQRILASIDDATLLQATPATWRMLVDAGWDGRTTAKRLKAISGGEALAPDLARAILARTRALWNGYGPSETAIYSTMHRVIDTSGPHIPIGRPLANTRVTVVDVHGAPVPSGIAGELVIGGAGVSPGYLGRPELTAERFIDDPAAPGERAYRTGDLVRWHDGGTLEYLGRIDRQVKVRGVRIEPGEIEHALEAHPQVRSALVSAREETPGDVRLVAHVIPTEPCDDLPARLRAYLSPRLPEALVPSAVVPLEHFPLLPNGKIDMQALPRPQGDHTGHARRREPPHTLTERALADLWAGLLGIERVGRDDGFFLLGGHSLLATRMVAQVLERFGVEVPLREVFRASRLKDLAATIDRGERASGETGPQTVQEHDGSPLSSGQERMWFLHALAPESPVYNMGFRHQIDGPLDAGLLAQALSLVVAQHEALRTTVRLDGDQPVQAVHAPRPVDLALDDLSALPPTEQGVQMERIVQEESAGPFDLANGPVFRARLVRLTPHRHIFLFVVHHIAFDETSHRILCQGLERSYEALRKGQTPTLPPPSLQYPDYAVWQRRRLEAGDLDGHLAHWNETLAQVSPLDLPTDHPRPARPTFHGGHITFHIPGEAAERLRALGQTEGATPFMTLLALFQAFLQRTARSERFAVGVPFDARASTRLQDTLGFFVNTLPLVADAAGDPTFRTFLGRVRDQCIDAFAHAEAPFERIVEHAHPGANNGATPLVNTFFSLDRKVDAAEGFLTGAAEMVSSPTAKFDLALYATETGDGYHCTLEHSSALFEHSTAETMARRIVVLLDAATRSPDTPLAALPLLDAAEEASLVAGWTATGTTTPQTPTHRLVAEQAARTPDAVAVDCAGDTLDYAQLMERVDSYAGRLRAAGAGPGTLVAVALDRSPDLVAGLLAVMETGAAYLPLDPTHPPQRLHELIEDARPLLVLSETSCVHALPDGVPRLLVDDDTAPTPVPDAPAADLPADLAYVIYTSGSTGRPKGVAVPHTALTSLLQAIDREIPVGPRDRWLAVTTVSFDIAALELFLPLIKGATVVLATRTDATDPQRLALHAADATHLQATPATWRMLIEDGWPGAPGLCALSGGETLPSDLAARLRRRVQTLWNVYGPTEATVWATVHRVDQDEAPSVPIGRPLHNMRAYVLDEWLHPVPPGLAGDLVLAGPAIAEGYLGRSDLTRERFLDDPFVAGARAYRTGDLVRMRDDGTLLFLGRRDRQVKIRGYRIEPAEVEAALRRHEAVSDAAVTVKGAPDDPRLVAYLVPCGTNGACDPEALRSALAERLPAYMVPAAFVPLETLPLTPNGKVDLDALPAPDGSALVRSRAALPLEGPVEEALAAIWRDLLAVEDVHADDDFFALGGHSLLATRLAVRLRAAFGIEVPLAELLETRTLRAMGRRIASLEASRASPADAPKTTDRADDLLSFGEERLLFLHQMAPQSAAYNMAVSRRLKGPLDVAALQRAFDEVVRHHAPLRTTYVLEGPEGPRRRVHRPTGVPLRIVHVDRPDEEKEEHARALATEEAHRPFDLEKGPLVRVLLLRMTSTEHILVVCVHHIVFDEWSERILLDDLAGAYAAIRAGRAPRPPALPLSYPKHASRERARHAAGATERSLAYWRENLAGVPSLDLPTDLPRPAEPRFVGGRVPIQIPAPSVEALAKVCRAEGATLHMGLLAAFQALLHRYTGQDDFAVGTPVANRSAAETEGLIGFLVNTLALRADLSGNPSLREVVARVRRTALDAYAHADAPFERIVEELPHVARDTAKMPVFQVAFLFGGVDVASRAFGDALRCTPFDLPSRTAKFDLTLDLAPTTDGGVVGHLEYDADLYASATAERMRDHLTHLADALAKAPDTPIADAPIITGDEEASLQAWGRNEQSFAGPRVIHHKIAAQARATPDAPAIQRGAAVLSYRELEEEASRLARHLVAKGVGRGDLVGIALPRTPDAFVAILGILKAGAAFLPLDPAYPQERLAFMVEDAAPRLVLTDRVHIDKVPVPADRVLRVDALGDDGTATDVALDIPLSPSDLAYVIYTSGSTGRPKGVLLEHCGPANLAAAQAHLFAPGPGDRVLQFASLNFDASVWELLMALTTGATLVLPPTDAPLVGEDLREILRDGITIATLPPTALATLSEGTELPALDLLIVAGEPCPPHLVATWSRGRRFVNAYGPTETSVCATAYLTRDAPAEVLPIGGPLPNHEVHVLDARLQPVPIGVPGELCVGGAGLARGYLNRPEATAARFVSHPTRPGERIYRTGDRVRWRADGQLEFLGRVDHQVKIRGHRIEPGEVEACLHEHEAVSEAVVIARTDDAVARLVAYVAPNQTTRPDARTLRAHVEERLPAHMVPSAIVLLDKFPLTPNGKIDRKALPAPGAETPSHSRNGSRSATDAPPADAAPRDRTEAVLVDTWREVLRVADIGIHDNFFALGGDSILSIQVVARARRHGVHLTARQLFDHQTVAELAAVVAGDRPVDAEQGELTGEAPLTPIQHWFFARDLPARHHFNQSVLLEVSDDVDAAHLHGALDHLLRHHDALRLRYQRGADGCRQTHTRPEDACRDTFLHVDLADVDDPAAQDAALDAEADAVQASLDLTDGPLVRAALFDLGPGRRRRLLIVAHHLVVDGVSWRILLEDLEAIVGAALREETPRLPPKSTSFKAWSERLGAHAASSERLREELGFWMQQTAEAPLPLDLPGGANTLESEDTVEVTLDSTTTKRLLTETTRRLDARPDEVLLAALSHALARWSGHHTVLLDIEGHGREEVVDNVDLTRTVGWFTTIHPLRIDLSAPVDAPRVLADVRRSLRAVPDRGIGHGLLTHLAGPATAATLAQLPQPQVSFNYLGRFDAAPSNASDGPHRFRILDAPHGREHAAEGTRFRVLEVNGLVLHDRLSIRFGYSRDLHHKATIEGLTRDFEAALHALIEAAETMQENGTQTSLPEAMRGLPAAVQTRLQDETPYPIVDAYPLTPMQHGMVFHSLKDPRSTVYVEQSVFVLDGEIDEDHLEQAWRYVFARHDVFRTRFAWQGLEMPMQIVQTEAPLTVERHDWSHLSGEETKGRLQDLLHDDRTRGFDLQVAPLLRITLIRSGPCRLHMVWTNHHAILDGWSLPVVLGELGQTYHALARGQEPRLPPVTPFGDFVRRLPTDRKDAAEHWSKRLEGLEGPTLPVLPAGPERAGDRDESDTLPGAVHRVLSPEKNEALKGVARRARVTLNTVVQGAWALALSRYSGEDDIVFGATVAGRPADLPGVEGTVGLFINTVPVRAAVTSERTVLDWLADLQRDAVEAREHEHTPLVDVQRASGLPPGTAVFEALFVFENYPWQGTSQDALPIVDVLGLSRTNYPLTFVAQPAQDLTLRLFYDETRFHGPAVARLLDHVALVLEEWTRDPERTLDAIPRLDATDRTNVTRWGATRHTATPRCIHELIAETAARASDAVALELGDERLTYADLERRAEAVARTLRQRGVRRGDIVALAAAPSPSLVVAAYGVLRSGAAYLPLDPSYPQERLAYMLDDSSARFIIADTGSRATLAPILDHRDDGPALLDLQGLADQTQESPDGEEALPHVDTHDSAYLIYTSGSTGRPKGVLVPHHGAAALAAAHRETFRLGPGDRVLQFASWSFDASFWELIMALTSGATLTFPPERLTGEALQAFLRDGDITAATLTPAVLKGLDPATLPELRVLVSAGEALSPDLAQRWAPGRAFFNAYGPTEATVCATIKRCAPDDQRTPTIGHPFAAARIAVVDRSAHPVPVGAPGEVAIGGDGLALGYHRRPELTRERFVPDPEHPGERLYLSGDLARWTDDGELEFLGRIDHQVKVRGHRIECGEVEAALRDHAEVADAYVLAMPMDAEGQGDAQLVAYMVPREGAEPDPADLRAHLGRTLPDHMIPTAYVPVDALPLTPSGKVDRHALPHPREARRGPRSSARYLAPRDAVEALLASIWVDVLDVPRVGARDDFFDLGGHSLSATQVVSRVRSALGIELPLRTLFSARTVEALAVEVRTLRDDGAALPLPPIERVEGRDRLPLSFAQQRLWFLDLWEPGSAVYNVPAFYRLKGALDLRALESALSDVVARHEVLRTVYRTDEEGRPYQVILPHERPTLPVLDLTTLPHADREARAEAIAEEEARRPFDLAHGPVYRLRLLRVASDEHWLLMAFHHIAFDGWSMGVLMDEMARLFRAHTDGARPHLSELPVQYADHAAWQRENLDETALEPQLAYWRDTLEAVPALAIPTDKPRPKVQSFAGAHRWFTLSEDLSERIRAFSRAEGVTLFMPLLAAFEALLHRLSGQERFAVGTPVAGRTHAETEDLIGFFVNTLVLRADLAGAPSFRGLVQRIRDTSLAAYANQDVPFENLVNTLAPVRDTSRSPLFQAMFVLQEDVDETARWGDVHVSGIPVTSGASKFDLTFFLANSGERLQGLVEYRTDLFEDTTIDRLAGRFRVLLEHALAEPDTPLAELPMLTEDEARHIVQVLHDQGLAVLDADGRAAPVGLPNILHIVPGHGNTPPGAAPVDTAPVPHPLAPDVPVQATDYIARLRADGQVELLGRIGEIHLDEEATATTAPGTGTPPRTETERILARIWSHVLGVEEIAVEDNFFALGGDSILAIRVITLAEQEGLGIAPKELFEHQTIHALARHLDTRTQDQDVQALVPLRREGTHAPFFCVHPIGGGVGCYAQLAEALPDRPFYALQARGIDEGDVPRDSVLEMAHAYLDEMKMVQPMGPYHIGGWSFGALVAHEMARILQESDEEVRLLALIDPAPPHESDEAGWEAGLDRLDAQTIMTSEPHLQNEMLRHLGLPALHDEGARPRIERHLAVVQANLHARRTHTVVPLRDVPAVLVQSEGSNRLAPSIADTWRMLLDDDAPVHILPGDHTSLILDPGHVRPVADVLAQHLGDMKIEHQTEKS